MFTIGGVKFLSNLTVWNFNFFHDFKSLDFKSLCYKLLETSPLGFTIEDRWKFSEKLGGICFQSPKNCMN